MSSTNTSTTTTALPKKKVHFGENEIHTIEFDPLYEPADFWLGGDECKLNFREQVIEYLTDRKRVMELQAAGTDVDEIEEDEDITGRGLEMYLPGAMKDRRHNRTTYSLQVIRKYRLFRDHSFLKDEEQRGEALRAFACLRNAASVERARYMARQDAIEACLIIAEHRIDEESTSTTSSKDSADFAPKVRHEFKSKPTNNNARAA